MKAVPVGCCLLHSQVDWHPGIRADAIGMPGEVYRQYAFAVPRYAVTLLIGITTMNEHHWVIPKHERKPGRWRVVGNVLHGLFVVAAILGAAFLLESLL